MSKVKKAAAGSELRPEYDFASMSRGVRGKYADRSRQGTNLILLEPDLADAFPSDEAVNRALRGVLATTRAVRQSGGLPNKTLRTSSDRPVPGQKRRAGAGARG